MEDLTRSVEWGLGQPLYFTLSVKDTGIGMSHEEIERLFGRFEQANARTTIKYGGSVSYFLFSRQHSISWTLLKRLWILGIIQIAPFDWFCYLRTNILTTVSQGLGLFLSQRLTEKQSGEIGVASEPGKGSTFVFYVKSRRTEEHGPPDTSQRIALTSRALSASATKSTLDGSFEHPKVELDKIHVLLVEDNEVNQKIVSRQLQKSGCVVYVASHGLEALSVLRETDVWFEPISSSAASTTFTPKHLDIILMDWEMPVMDGLTATREIRKFQAQKKVTRHVDIIATTANARDEQIAVALDSGVDEVVSKPFMVADLLVRIRERLSMPPRMTVERAVTAPWDLRIGDILGSFWMCITFA
jgi:CheY-like chemotaxis protein